jgi:hypothetical protein
MLEASYPLALGLDHGLITGRRGKSTWPELPFQSLEILSPAQLFFCAYPE